MNRAEMVSWLNNEVMRNQVYHNHKENMAWGATALYVTGAIALGATLGSAKVLGSEGCNRLVVLILAVVASVIAVFFVQWQFNQRRKASCMVDKLMIYLTRLHGKDHDRPEECWRVKSGEVYPDFILEMTPSGRAGRFDDKWWQSELPSYAIMALALHAFIFLVCR